MNARSKICRANPGGHKSMRTTTNTGSEQGQRIGHFRSSPPRTIKTASRLRSSPEVERFTVLCASYSVVLDNRLRSWDANERSIFNLPLLLIPEITNLRVISKKRLFSIFRVLCSYIYKDGSFCNDFKKKLWILLFFLHLPEDRENVPRRNSQLNHPMDQLFSFHASSRNTQFPGLL